MLKADAERLAERLDLAGGRMETPVGTLPENVVAATPRLPLPVAPPALPIKPKPAWQNWIEARAAARRKSISGAPALSTSGEPR